MATPGMSETASVDAVIERLVEPLKRAECVLFLGAGVHAPPPEESPYAYPQELRPSSAAALSERLAEQSQFNDHPDLADESPFNLMRSSAYFEMVNGRTDLVRAIRDAVHAGKQPSPLLRGLAALDFPVVITTNYDQLFEDALRSAGKRPHVAVYNPERESGPVLPPPSTDEPIVIKLHGDIDTPASVVVTDEDYIHFVLRMSDPQPINPLPVAFQYHFQVYPTLFVGYSLLDYNLRALFLAMRWKVDQGTIPPTFALDIRPDPLIVDVWWNQRRYVRFVTADAWAFVPALYERIRGEEMPL